ncbi:MAG: response regulator transcription factor [Lachnospiraceae bacterium]|nr:response regulator transcription factor [Lachnospiraceae bacterium]
MEHKYLIHIVEDDEVMARLNERLLKRQGYAVLVSHNVNAARQQAGEKKADLFILDVTLPDGDGFSLCEELKQITDVPILFLTGKTKPKDKVTGLDNGGDYYLTKPYDKDELLAVIKSLLRRFEQARKKVDESTIIVKGSITLNIIESKAYINGHNAGLSPKEFAIFLLLAQNEDKEITSEQIITKVWGDPASYGANSVRVYISRLREKLGEEAAEDFAIFTSYGRGYTFTTFSEKQ